MALTLPPAYTAQSKNECVQAVISAIEEEIGSAREAAKAGSIVNFMDALQKAYYYAGIGAALSVLSTSHLSSELTDKLNARTYAIIRAQYWIRARCLGVSPSEADGKADSEVRVPKLGDKVNSSQLAGWETNDSRQNLTITILNQLVMDIGIASTIKSSKKKISKRELADFSSMTLNDSFMLGFLYGIKFARGEQEFASMEGKVKVQTSSGGYIEYSVPDLIAIVEKQIKDLNTSAVISDRIRGKAIATEEKVETIKPVKPVVVTPPVAGASNDLARYLRVCII